MTGETPASVLSRHRHLGTCGDCYIWRGPRGSAHDPWRCPFLRDAISRLEREIQEKQERLASLNITLSTEQNAKSPTADVASSDSTSNRTAVSLEVPDA